MTRTFHVVDKPKLKDSQFTGSPAAAARKAGNELLGSPAGSKTVTVKVQENGSDKVCAYKVTKTKRETPQEVSFQQKDGTTKTVVYKYDIKVSPGTCKTK